jgi:alpha-beta hydrolase superfamily lysophospholipase
MRTIICRLLAVLLFPIAVYPFDRDTLRRQLPPLTDHSIVTGGMFPEYLHRYGLDTFNMLPDTRARHAVGIRPIAGTFRSDSFTCVGQIYRCDNSRGTVFFLHGLFDHTGTVANGIGACLRENFTVATFDLPGHGLSGGERSAIGDFSEYAGALREFLRICTELVDTPYIFIGHSTGCAVAYEYAATSTEQPFEKVIFLAPLARPVFYHLALVGNAVLRLFVPAAPRWYRAVSHDRDFLLRQRDDPLQANKLPVRWATAYFLWWERSQAYRRQTLPLTVIQGTGDGVVDWRYNLPWFGKKVEGCTIIKIPKARHQLLNEAEPYRSECIGHIREILRHGE